MHSLSFATSSRWEKLRLNGRSTWPEPAAPQFLTACEQTVRPSDDLLVIYTSGSTSNPKGIVHTHGTAITHSRFIAAEHDWGVNDRIYVPMVFFWVAGLVFGLLGPLQLGATVLTEHRFDAGHVLRLLEAEQATSHNRIPTRRPRPGQPPRLRAHRSVPPA